MEALKSSPIPADHRGKSYWSNTDVFNPAGKLASCFLHRAYEIGMHAHEFAEINVVIAGRGEHHVGDHAFVTTAGDVFVIPPNVKHSYTNIDGLDVYHLLLSPQIVAEHSLQLHLLPGYLPFFTIEPYFRPESDFRYGLHLEPDHLIKIASVFEAMDDESRLSPSGSQLALNSLALYTQVLLCRWYAEQHPSDALRPEAHPQVHALRHVFDLVAEQHGEKITLEMLASAAHMQRTYFCRLFHSAMGMTPMAYVNRYRLLTARKLLQETDATVTEIALQVGFYDTAHFSRAFTKLTGTSPSRFRRG
ncbi:MAG TPA: AraC family transcriptional regulator [Capsulimonadaceae bacterium]|jgi:AraC family L-rhamnose operon regulatory protein RhaS